MNAEPSRRDFLALALAGSAVVSAYQAPKKLYAFVSSWTKDPFGQGGSGGITTFEPSDKFLFVGNQTTNQMVTFAVAPNSGKITPAGAKTDAPKPACIKYSNGVI